MGYTEFYRQSSDLKKDFKWGEVFSEVFSSHTQEQKEKILVSGCKAYMPKESNMLSQWTKPWMFARFGLIGVIFCALIIWVTNTVGTYATMAMQVVVPAFIMPVTILIFMWEMNIPRNISLIDIIKYMMFAGGVSIFLTIVIRTIIFRGQETEAWVAAPIPEELAKFLLVYFIVKTTNSKYILNGLLIGCSVGAGFAAIESAGYAFSTFSEVFIATGDYWLSVEYMSKVNVLRGLTAICGHTAWAAMYGAALVAAKKHNPLNISHVGDKLVLITLIAAILLHTAFNYDYDILMTRFIDVEIAQSIYIFWEVYYGKYFVLGGITWMIIFKLMRMGLVQVIDIGRRSVDSSRGNAGKERRTPIQAASMQVSPQYSISVYCMSGVLSGKIFSANKEGQIIFGRGGDAIVRFPDGTKGISGKHCEIKIKENVPVIIDRGSTYGTYFADGRKLEVNKPYRIENGMEFYLAQKDNSFVIKM